jgi:lipopolysaccharide/colanic/teichoic acid biosynthesis glycosyltransferase
MRRHLLSPVTSSKVLPMQRLKLAIDLALGAIFLCATLPVIVLSAALVRLASPGPAFFWQRREGLGGEVFLMWKIRTMRIDAQETLAYHLAAHPKAKEEWERYRRLACDPRVIPGIGRFLRRTSLDELPQLWNVVRGDMSLVGPRPIELEVLERFDPEFRRLRQTVRPGLTGLWQVSGRSEGDMQELKAIDAAYLREWSLLLDLKILCHTLWAVLSRRGAY